MRGMSTEKKRAPMVIISTPMRTWINGEGEVGHPGSHQSGHMGSLESRGWLAASGRQRAALTAAGLPAAGAPGRQPLPPKLPPAGCQSGGNGVLLSQECGSSWQGWCRRCPPGSRAPAIGRPASLGRAAGTLPGQRGQQEGGYLAPSLALPLVPLVPAAWRLAGQSPLLDGHTAHTPP